MSKIDDKYIDALKTFTEALEEIVKALQEQQKTGKSDVVNEMLNNTPTESLQTVIKDLQKTTEKGFKDLKDDNEKILKKIESIKQQKESGSFEKVEDPKNKNKIVDGIRVVILIAAGVLALGMAFKIIGKVDFLSVIALSTAMVIMAAAYAKIADIKGLTYKKALMTAAILPMISIGLLLSALVLKYFPTFSIGQGLSLVLVGGALGVSAWFLLRSLEHVNIAKNWKTIIALPLVLPLIAGGLFLASFFLRRFPTFGLMQGLSLILVGGALGVAAWFLLRSLEHVKIKRDWATILALPLILPLIAAGLLLSGVILRAFPTFGLMQGLSMILVAGAMGVATFLILKSIGKVDVKKNWATILALPLMLPLIAFGLVLSSKILKDFVPLKNPWQILLGSLVIGLSVLAFAPAIYILGKMKLADIAKGILAVLAIPFAIVGASVILQAFAPLKTPWQLLRDSLVMGLSILFFAPAVYLIGKMSLPQIVKGALGVLAIAGIILATAWIFTLLPAKMIHPPIMWTLGVGLSILAFGILGLAVGFAVADPLFWIGLLALMAIAGTIVGVSRILNKGTYDKYPPLKWALGVGLSLIIFSVVAVAAAIGGIVGAIGSLFTGGKDPLVKLAQSMVDISVVLQNGIWNNNYPSLGWAMGVGASLLAFATVTVLASAGSLVSAVLGFFSGDKDPLMTLATSMVEVSKKLQEGVWTGNYPKYDWALGVGTALLLFAGVTALAGVANLATAVLNFFGGDEDPLMSIANSMVEVSKKLQEGIWAGNYPKYDWALGVGTAMTLFAGVTVLSGAASLAKSVLGFFSGDKDPLVTLAISMTAVSWVLNSGNWKGGYPKYEWSLAVGSAMIIFAGITVLTSATNLAKSVIGFFSGDKDPLVTLATSMMAVSWIIASGNWKSNYPEKEWTDSVATAMVTFAKITILQASASLKSSILGFFSGDKDPLGTLATSMVKVSYILGGGNWKGNFPGMDWSSSVGTAMLLFAKTATLQGKEFADTILGIFGLGKKDPLINLANSMVQVSWVLGKGQYTKYPTKEWSEGVKMGLFQFISLSNFVSAFVKGKNVDRTVELTRSIVFISQLLTSGKYQIYPSLKWTGDVKTLLLDFANMESISMRGFQNKRIINLTQTIVDTSKLLASGKYDIYPTIKWTSDVIGLLLTFSKTPEVENNEDLLDISTTIFNISKILNSGKYDIYPTVKWTSDVIGLLLTFSKTPEVKNNKDLIDLSTTILQISKLLSSGQYDIYPTATWVSDINTVMLAFAAMSIKADIDSDKLIELSRTINQVSLLMASGKYDIYPTNQWVTDINSVLLGFISISMIATAIDGKKLLDLTRTIVATSILFSNGKYSVYPTVKWVSDINNVLTAFAFMSLTTPVVDTKKLTNLTSTIVATSIMFSLGRYSIYPTKEYMDALSYNILVISDIVKKSDFSLDKSNQFGIFSRMVLPAMRLWIQMISQEDFSKIISFEYTNTFTYFTNAIGQLVDNWGPSIKESSTFMASISLIVPALKQFSTVPIVDASFVQSIISMRYSLSEVARGIDEFKSHNIKLEEFLNFTISMGFITRALDQFSKVPIVNDTFLQSMIVMKSSLKELSEGLDTFLYDSILGIKTKKSMVDFVNFANGIRTISLGLKTLGELKPIPNSIVGSLQKFLTGLDKIPTKLIINDKIDGIKKLADSLLSLANSLTTLNSSLGGFLNMSKGLFLISIIDDIKLGKVLKSVEDHQKALKIAYSVPEEQSNLKSIINSLYQAKPKEEEKGTKVETESDQKQKNQFYGDVADIKSILYQFLETLDKPSQAGHFSSK